MKITNIEKRVLRFIERHLDILFIAIMIALSLWIRFSFFPLKSGDWVYYLKPWMESLEGGFSSIGNYIGNYNYPYVMFLAAISHLPGEALPYIKGLSIIVDYLGAFASASVVYQLLKKSDRRKFYAILTFVILIFMPTIFLNSAAWGQCDMIYTLFVILSLRDLIEKKYTRSFLLLGVAFAFKLQFIFILPVYFIYYFTKKDFSIFNFLLIPLADLVLCIPAMFFGASFFDIVSVYFRQAGTYSDYLVMNFPNLYQFLPNLPSYFYWMGLLITVMIFGLLLYWCLKEKVTWNSEKIFTVSLWSILIATYFLPGMHDRYLFMAEVISVLWCILYRKNILVPICVSIIGLIPYIQYLFSYTILDQKIVSFAFLLLIICFTKLTLETLQERKTFTNKEKSSIIEA